MTTERVHRSWTRRRLYSSQWLRAALPLACVVAFGGGCVADAPRVVAAREMPTPTGMSVVPDEDAGEDVRVEATACTVDEAYIGRHKACREDDDCAVFSYRQACCTQLHVVGISAESLEEAEACRAPSERRCGECDDNDLPERAEDERVVSEVSLAVALCVEGRCQSRVASRACGASRRCGPKEICVRYENVIGGIPPDPDSKDNALETFRCVPNPCGSKPLSCECIQPVCDARNDTIRQCEIKRNFDTDVHCSAYKP